MGITFSFKDIKDICRRLNLSIRKSKNNFVLEGVDPNSNFIRISIHWKADGRNLAKGTVSQIAKDLGFKDVADMHDFLQNKKRKR